MSDTLSIQNVSKTYGKQTILDSINFKMQPGEIVGLVGPNGAGKTTLMKIITGLIPNYSGEVLSQGVNIKHLQKTRTKRIGCVIETPGFYPNLTGYENLLFAATLSGLNNKNEMNEIIDILGISSFLNKKTKHYSLGMRQRLGVAQAVLSYPPLLVLDEPTNGLDPEIVPQLRKFVQYISEKRKISVLISSHILSEIELMCHRVVFIQDGKILAIESLNQELEQFIAFETSNIKKMMEFFDVKNLIYTVVNSNTIHLSYSSEQLEDLVSELVSSKVPFSSVYEVKTNLENKYLKTIGEIKNA